MSASSSIDVIITSSPDVPITAYDASTGAAVAHFPGSRSPFRGLAMASRELIAASHISPDTGKGSIHLYIWHNSSVFLKLDVPEPVVPLYGTSDGAFLFAGGVSGKIHSFSLPSGDLINSFEAHSKSVSSLNLSDDESLMVSGSDDGTIVVIPTCKLLMKGDEKEDQKNSILYQFDEAHLKSVTWLKFGIGCNSTFVSSSLDHTVKFWSLTSKIQTWCVKFPCPILGVVMDSTESVFYAGGHDGLVYKGLMKVETRKTLRKPYDLGHLSKTKRHGGSIVSLVLVNHGRVLVSAADDGSVWAWDVEKGDFIIALANMGRITHMIMNKGVPEYNFGKRNNVVGSERSGFTSSRLCEEEMIKTMKQITDVGDVMDMIEKDKKKAIDMMESNITTYEKYLILLREEAAEEEEITGKENNKKENRLLMNMY